VDTAGIRRKGKTTDGGEAFRGHGAPHLEAADVALLVIDATEGVTALTPPSAATRMSRAAASSSREQVGRGHHPAHRRQAARRREAYEDNCAARSNI
jgi:hypothetical protein